MYWFLFHWHMTFLHDVQDVVSRQLCVCGIAGALGSLHHTTCFLYICRPPSSNMMWWHSNDLLFYLYTRLIVVISVIFIIAGGNLKIQECLCSILFILHWHDGVQEAKMLSRQQFILLNCYCGSSLHEM